MLGRRPDGEVTSADDYDRVRRLGVALGWAGLVLVGGAVAIGLIVGLLKVS
jgi:hypothetical protein